ncbi:hypothetical protein FDP41_004125 [Naegleria fowleri]|uniref:Uncharacterized protein n=1 Tax=Naegleria fowleri TaxID=5763 RepID=A0A6A5BSQ7_NAEFO|nr:uncharacterized protein FDP41_004125 [Naegleria fowleri]KAF0976830.1 hypothetical protein FDP41_004125 [Naegleria fowleri]CAG4710166.1 unnamed protein product [Naegleria fowleri]
MSKNADTPDRPTHDPERQPEASSDSAASSSQGIRIPANSLKDLLKSEYSQVTREAIQKKYQEQGTNIPFKARVEAKIQGFYGGNVGPQALNPLRKGIHEQSHKRGWTPLQKKITLLFGSFILGQLFYFGGRYIFNNFISSNKQMTNQSSFYYGRDVNEFNSEVDKLTGKMVNDYKKFKGSDDVTPEEYKMIERDALNRVSLKYAQQHEILGSASQTPSSSKYVPR